MNFDDNSTDNPFDGPVGGYTEEETEESDPAEEEVETLDDPVPETEDDETSSRVDWKKPNYDEIINNTDLRRRGDSGGDMSDLKQPSRYTYLPVYSYTLGHISLDSFAYSRADYLDDDVDEQEQIGNPVTLGDTDKRFTWWEDESLTAKYPYVFINPVITAEYMDKTDNHAYHLLRTEAGEQFVLTDSGGFQMLSRDEGEVMDEPGTSVWKKAKINPTDLAQWQVDNADAGLVLDIPPYEMVSKEARKGSDKAREYQDWRDDLFERRLSKTISNAAEMHDAWDAMSDERLDDFYRMGVIQGQPDMVNTNYQYEPLETWHESLEEVGDYDGFSIKPSPVDDIGQVTLHLGYVVDRLLDYDYIHVLQLGSAPMKQLCMFAANQSGQWITSDAGSWAAATMWRQVFLPSAHNHRTCGECGHTHAHRSKVSSRTVTITSRTDEEREDSDQEATRFDMYPCRCEVCSVVDDEMGIGYITQDDSDSRRNASLCMHNLQMILQDDRVLQSLQRAHWDTLLDDLSHNGKATVNRYGNEYWHMLSTLLTDREIIQIHQGMQFIKDCNEKGIAEANKNVTFHWYQDDGQWTYGHNQATDW